MNVEDVNSMKKRSMKDKIRLAFRYLIVSLVMIIVVSLVSIFFYWIGIKMTIVMIMTLVLTELVSNNKSK